MSALASSAMPRRLPPGCIEDRDRHGNIRIYFRAKGRAKVRIRGTPWTPEFMANYEAAKGESRTDTEERDHSRYLALAMRPLFFRMRGLPSA